MNVNRFSRMVSVTRVIILATLASVASACGGTSEGSVNYAVSAKENYDKGQTELGDEDYIAAAKYFSFLKARFPYSKYAVLAELRLADAEFAAGHHPQAIDSYKLFIKFHPTHEMVTNGYAAFRIGEAYTRMLPDDWWLLPPAHEKDQSASSDAERELRAFLQKYPDSPYTKRGKELLANVADRLAAHEWYVANFYWDRGKPMGTVLRLRRLLKRYSGVGYDANALWLLGRAYKKVGMLDRATATWQELVKEHPEHEHAGEARSELSKLALSQ